MFLKHVFKYFIYLYIIYIIYIYIYMKEIKQKNQGFFERVGLYKVHKILYETNQIGSSVYESLTKQNDQLKNVSEKIDQTTHDIDRGEYILKKMSSFWYRIFLWFWGEPVYKDKTKCLFDNNNIELSNDNQQVCVLDDELNEIIEDLDYLYIVTNNINKTLKKQNKIIDVISDKSDYVSEKSENINKIIKLELE